LVLLGRRHTVADIYQAVRVARRAGLGNIGLDLIYAIPGSNLDTWYRNLCAAISLGVEHISTYALTIETGTAIEAAVAAGKLEPIDEETDCRMYELAIDVLESSGYQQYEISNFARPGFACRHNLGYWLGGQYIGIGPAAASYWQGRLTRNLMDVRGYTHAIEAGLPVICESEPVSDRQVIWQTAVLNLRMRQGIEIVDFAEKTGHDPLDLFGHVIDRYVRDGVMAVEEGRIFLTRKGMLIADYLLYHFVL
jgi:oxygen-independent coproporphyrinogen-3 oxidase